MRALVICAFTSAIILILRNSPTNGQQASPPQMTCNSCCQGPAGSQGTPGIPGVPGIPGNIGPKGDRGDSVKGDEGPRGEKGDLGGPGLIGDGGPRGPPGKVGPMGVAGPSGSSGIPGVKGQKGELGQSRAQAQLSAFSAVRSSSFTPSSVGQALPFDVGTVHTNIGNDFDAASGRFTCTVPGLYLFTYTITTYEHDPLVCLYKDNEKINCVYRHDQNKWDESSNTAVLQLSTGEQVWLWCRDAGKTIRSDSNRSTSFSGVILHQL